MRPVLDGKRLLVGGFAGAALVASLGALEKGAPQAGRYAVAAAGNDVTLAHVYVVDTATKQVWRVTEIPRESAGPPKAAP